MTECLMKEPCIMTYNKHKNNGRFAREFAEALYVLLQNVSELLKVILCSFV